VGTWLHKLPPKLKKVPQKFELKPSVGTWLAVIPPGKKKDKVEQAETKGVIMNTLSRVGPAFASLGLPNSVHIF